MLVALAVVLLILLFVPEDGVLPLGGAVAAVADLFIAGAGAGVGVVVADVGTYGVRVLDPCFSCWSVGPLVLLLMLILFGKSPQVTLRS